MNTALSPEARILVEEAVRHLSAGYDEALGLVRVGPESRPSARDSMYAALGLLILGTDQERACRICEAVLDLQLTAPGEIWHGCFRHHPGEPFPPPMPFDWRRLNLEGRYFADLTWEHLTGRYGQLLADSALSPAAREKAAGLLLQALRETVPVVWDTYEPNLREFIGMVFAMLLEHFEDRLPVPLVRRLEESGRQLMIGSIARARSDFTPLNTNIRIMYIFLLDWFGRRLGELSWVEESLLLARNLLAEYREFHSVAEFNSPTYYGVDLSTIGFWRRYGSSEELQTLGAELEEGLWRDAAAFYNPEMRNFCGPYSRNYEMEMHLHTCFCDLMYLGLGAERFPWHPFSEESVCNPLLALGQVRIPEDIISVLTGKCVPHILKRSFRELSERGDPACRHALCTAMAYITPTLMLGTLSGSENPSHQLHPLTVFWRSGDGIGTIRLLRSLPDGRMIHLHTVLFNGVLDHTRIHMQVDNLTGQDVDIFYEIACAGIPEDRILPDRWDLPGLTVHLSADAPAPVVRRVDQRTVRVVYPSRIASPDSLHLHFQLDPEQKE